MNTCFVSLDFEKRGRTVGQMDAGCENNDRSSTTGMTLGSAMWIKKGDDERGCFAVQRLTPAINLESF